MTRKDIKGLKSSVESVTPDFGIVSINDKMYSSETTKSNNSMNYNDMTMVSQLSSSTKGSAFRVIVCGDSGIGKSALVSALSSMNSDTGQKAGIDPIEVYNPSTNQYIIDTMGYGALLRPEVVFSHVEKYFLQQFEKTRQIFNKTFNDQEKVKYIIQQCNQAFTHVDACLYLIMGRIKPVDIEYMKTIHNLVNIIPVIIHSDLSLLRSEALIEIRLDLVKTLQEHQINYCKMGYQDVTLAIKENSVQCTPFVLDWSTTATKLSKTVIHGLTPLKQALFQHQYHLLKHETTLKYTHWLDNMTAMGDYNCSTTSSYSSSGTGESGGGHGGNNSSSISHGSNMTNSIISNTSSHNNSSHNNSSHIRNNISGANSISGNNVISVTGVNNTAAASVNTAAASTATNTNSATTNTHTHTHTHTNNIPTPTTPQQDLDTIRISQYVIKRRHSMEKELLIQEQKLKAEFENASKQKKTELILREVNALFEQQQKRKLQQQHQQQQQQQQHSFYWIYLSVFLLLIICYQNSDIVSAIVQKE